MTVEATKSSDRMKHGFSFDRMFTTGQKKKRHCQWDLHRLVSCKTTRSGRQTLHVAVAGLILVRVEFHFLYIKLVSNLCSSESKCKCGQQLQVAVQVLGDTRTFDCLTHTDIPKGPVNCETSVTDG